MCDKSYECNMFQTKVLLELRYHSYNNMKFDAHFKHIKEFFSSNLESKYFNISIPYYAYCVYYTFSKDRNVYRLCYNFATNLQVFSKCIGPILCFCASVPKRSQNTEGYKDQNLENSVSSIYRYFFLRAMS